MTARFALAGLRLIARTRHLALKAMKLAGPVVQPVYRTTVKWLILPLYKLLTMVRLRMNRLALGVRGFIFLVLTNRYVFHAVLLAISVAAITTQLQAKNATALEAGQRSLLYTLVTDGEEAFVEETVRPELIVKDSHYLGADTLEATIGIDYDYEPMPDIAVADIAVPGSIAAIPGSEAQPGQPGQTTPTKRTKTETYTVQEGDTVSTIAANFGVNVGTILWANNLTNRSTIKPGQALRVPPQSGVLHTIKSGDTLSSISKKYDVSVDEIMEANQLTDASVLALGEELILPGATPPPTPVAAASNVNLKPDVPLSRISNKAYDLYQEITGTNDDREKPQDIEEAAPSTQLLWPTDHHLINQYFGWRHTGLDIHGRYNNAIYASEDGVVEFAGWNNGGYGLMILVNHGGGMKTRYAHASKLFVKAGQQVKRGEVMAMVGTTGRSTGPHLHYEVIINGKYRNPLAYTK